jgi:hypothetical protein
MKSIKMKSAYVVRLKGFFPPVKKKQQSIDSKICRHLSSIYATGKKPRKYLDISEYKKCRRYFCASHRTANFGDEKFTTLVVEKTNPCLSKNETCNDAA